MKKKLALFLVSVAALFLLAACGSGGGDSGGKDGKKDASGGGELKIALSSSIASLDPISYTAVYESNIMRSVFNTLVSYDKDMQEIVPELAESWTISKDMQTYTFKLREDVHFHKGKYQDGRKMVADDVKYSLERSLNESALNRLRNVKEITVISDTELSIELEQPYAAFLAMLTDMGNVIVPHEEVEGWGDKFGQNPVGTGPFVFKEWLTDDYVQLVRNDDYWLTTPNLSGVKFSFITDKNMMGNALQSGDIDVATDISGQNVELIEKNDNLVLEKVNGLSIGYLSFNVTEGPTKDLKVRQAMNLALDKDELLKGFYKYGEAKTAYLPLPRSSWGYSEKVAQKVKEQGGPNVDEAKKLLADAGYPDGFDIELYTSEARVAAATIVQNQMEKIGINISIKAVEWGTFSDTVSSGKAPLYIMGWSWYPDPDFFLYQLFDSKQIGSLGNGGGYNNPKVDELLLKATSTTTDEKERAAIYEEALDIITDDLPHLDLYDQDIIVGLSKKVKGYNVRPDNSIYLVTNETNVSLED
ncbi:ABC transporter substrate-binding protein [Vagococcus acidifermentans]|uniref:Peptide ABC transporter substrate-binding protein n=1 Tax=Vagococcus acidifermentans TaxID=564710 RepID=A0A430B0W5_9ENTE|nr:ABC transporter substrate-binding protein [Vagococcus acidifermentans]RSU13946.1 peptide ABC transporter substrate-binding protein [Vagococcus acidifermentans]